MSSQWEARVPETLRHHADRALGAWVEAGGAHESVPALVRSLVLAAFYWDKGGPGARVCEVCEGSPCRCIQPPPGGWEG